MHTALDHIYKCFVCDKSFHGSKILLVDPEPCKTIVEPDKRFIYFTNKNIPKMSNKPALKENGDKVLACPFCKKIQLSGFDFIK